MAFFRRGAAKPAPEKVPHVVQEDGWVQGTWREAGSTVNLSTEAARYLVSAGVLKTKEDHEAAEAAKAEAAEKAAEAASEDESHEAPAEHEEAAGDASEAHDEHA